MYTSTQQVDDRLDDLFSKNDDIRERYHRELDDIKMDELIEQDWKDYMIKVWDSGFGTDSFAYEAYWKRLEEYSYRNYS